MSRIGVKVLIFIFVCISVFQDIQAQNDSLNHQKYGWMRYRIRNYFQHMGYGPGESLPAGLIREYHTCKELERPSRIVDWGDGTIFLGWYLGVLGTEYKLLRNAGERSDSTLRELYLALNAFDRLDKNAEIVWSNFDGVTKKGKVRPVEWDSVNRRWLGKDEFELNGFFLRNDAGPDFARFFPFATGIGSALSGVYNPIDTNYFGEYQVCPPFTYRAFRYYPMNEPSHDQIFPLLMGLILTYECSDEFMVWNGQNLGERARETALRMINHYDQDWKYRNPARKEFGNGCNAEGCMPYNGGGYSIAYAYPLALIGNYLQEGKKLYKSGPGQTFKDLQNPYMTGVSFLTKPVFKNLTPLFYNHHVNHHMEVVIASISNAYAGKSGSRSARYIWERVHDNEVGWEFYYLLNRFLFPNKTDFWPKEFVEKELDLCPPNGPHWLFDKQKKATHSAPWVISNRFVFGFKNGMQWSAKDSLNPWFKGYFSGSDYMLLYNIYRLVFPDTEKSLYSLEGWMDKQPGDVPSQFVSTSRVFGTQLSLFNKSSYATLKVRLLDAGQNVLHEGVLKDDMVLETGELKPGFYTLWISDTENKELILEKLSLINGDGLYRDSQ